jgi:hypothetical protein
MPGCKFSLQQLQQASGLLAALGAPLGDPHPGQRQVRRIEEAIDQLHRPGIEVASPLPRLVDSPLAQCEFRLAGLGTKQGRRIAVAQQMLADGVDDLACPVGLPERLIDRRQHERDFGSVAEARRVLRQRVPAAASPPPAPARCADTGRGRGSSARAPRLPGSVGLVQLVAGWPSTAAPTGRPPSSRGKHSVATSGAWRNLDRSRRTRQRVMNPAAARRPGRRSFAVPGDHRLGGDAGVRAVVRQALQRLLGARNGEVCPPLEVALQTA